MTKELLPEHDVDEFWATDGYSRRLYYSPIKPKRCLMWRFEAAGCDRLSAPHRCSATDEQRQLCKTKTMRKIRPTKFKKSTTLNIGARHYKVAALIGLGLSDDVIRDRLDLVHGTLEIYRRELRQYFKVKSDKAMIRELVRDYSD